MDNIKYSQNFLYNKKLLENLIRKTNLVFSDIVIEIGSGNGIITEAMSKICKKVIAIELDANLYNNLKIKFKNYKNIEIINADFLTYKLPDFEYKIVSNIPFNITNEIIKKIFFLNENKPQSVYLFMQYEAFLKYSGKPFYTESLKSIILKPLFSSELIKDMEPTDFKPKPNVRISFVGFIKNTEPKIDEIFYQDYIEFISYIFTISSKGFKSKTKRIFSYNQQKILMKKLNIADDMPILNYSMEIWYELFNVYCKLVSKEKKVEVKKYYLNWSKSQNELNKVHRTINNIKIFNRNN